MAEATKRRSRGQKAGPRPERVVRATGFVIETADDSPRAEPRARGAEGRYEDGFGRVSSVEEFYDSVDSLLGRVRRRANSKAKTA